jgi:PEP-CTERM motif
MKALVILLSLVVGLLGTVPASDAKPVEFVFTAVVASAEHPVFPTVNPGDFVVGKYFFESSTPDSDPNPTRGSYLSSGHFDARIGMLSFSFPLSFIEVLDNFGGGSADRYTVAAMSGNTLLELTLLAETNPNAFTNDLLPLVPPALSAFSSRNFQVFVRNQPGSDFISKIDANVVTLVVPEPSAMILLMSGVAFLAGTAGWRKRR